MNSFISNDTFRLLVATAKTQAVAGAVAGMVLGVIRGISSVRNNQFNDGYDAAAEGLTQVGTGTILGAMGAVAGTVVGVSVAAAGGRAVLTIALPLVASAVTAGVAHPHVERVVRPWSVDLMRTVKHGREDPTGTSRISHSRAP